MAGQGQVPTGGPAATPPDPADPLVLEAVYLYGVYTSADLC